MMQKLRLTPDVCYIFGVYSCNSTKESGVIRMSSNNEAYLERFVEISINKLLIEPNKLLMNRDITTKEYTIKFYNSKIKKFFDKSHERIDHIFKYKNDYTANYFAGIFDKSGRYDKRGIYFYKPTATNIILLERLGFHTTQAKNIRIRNEDTFITFINKYSLRMQSIVHLPGNERDLR